MIGDRPSTSRVRCALGRCCVAGKVAHAAREAGREFRVQAALESGGAGVSAVAAQVQMTGAISQRPYVALGLNSLPSNDQARAVLRRQAMISPPLASLGMMKAACMLIAMANTLLVEGPEAGGAAAVGPVGCGQGSCLPGQGRQQQNSVNNTRPAVGISFDQNGQVARALRRG